MFVKLLNNFLLEANLHFLNIFRKVFFFFWQSFDSQFYYVTKSRKIGHIFAYISKASVLVWSQKAAVKCPAVQQDLCGSQQRWGAFSTEMLLSGPSALLNQTCVIYRLGCWAWHKKKNHNDTLTRAPEQMHFISNTTAVHNWGEIDRRCTNK